MFFILGGSLDAPTFIHPHTFMTPIHSHAPRGVHTPICPHTLLCICMFSEALHVVGVVRVPLCVRTCPLHHPCLGVPPLHGHPQTQLLASLCIGMFQAYKYVMWAFSLLLKGLGVFPNQLGGLGYQHLRCPYAHSCIYFCSALCLMFLLWLRLLLLWLQWYLLACHQCHQ